MSKIKGKVIFDGAAAEPKGYVTDSDVEFNANDDGVLQSLRVGKKNYTIPQGGGGGGAKIYKHELTWNDDGGYPRNTVCGYFRRSAQYTSMEGFAGDAICITGFTRSGQPKNSGSWTYAATETLKFYEGSSVLFSVNIDTSAPDSYTVTEL